MQIFFMILIILFIARICAEIAEMLRQPALVGELVAGIILGYLIQSFGHHFNVTLDIADQHAFQLITNLGIFFLMLLAGLELGPKKMKSASRSASGIALGGLLLPLALGCTLGYVFIPQSEYKLPQVLFIGTAIAITAVPVAVRALMDVNMLDTKLGRCIISAAVMDDVLSLVLLAILTGIIATGTMPGATELFLLFLKIGLFFAVCWVLGRYLFDYLGNLIKRSHVPEGEFSGLLIMGLSFALLAEVLELHFIIGAFFGGLMFRARHVGLDTYHMIEERVKGITSGFLAPIFFVSIGLHVTFEGVLQTPVFAIALLLVAIIGKVVGAGLPAYFLHKDLREATVIGAAMNGRGAVELIILDVAARANLFSYPEPTPVIISSLFSNIVLMAIITTIMTPVLLKILLRN